MFALPDPLHPAVIHLPLGAAVLLPLLALVCVAATAGDRASVRPWWGVVLVAALAAGGAFLAEETGHDQEERVEKIVAEEQIDEHEERAEWFVRLAVGTLVIAAAGLLRGRVGRVARIATVAASLLLLAAGVRVGESGGELVYVHGAANAYVEGAAGQAASPGAPEAGALPGEAEHTD